MFVKVFDGLLGRSPVPLGPQQSNCFVVQAESPPYWGKIRIGLYSEVEGLGLVEIATSYIPVGDDRKIMEFIRIPGNRYAGPFLAFAENVPRFPNSLPFKITIHNGDSENMLYEPLDANAIGSAIATKSEISSDIVNTSANAVAVVKPANPLRRGGFLDSRVNGTVYIGFGGPPARKDTSKLVKNAKLEIPDNFTGEIFVDWNGNQVAAPSPSGQFKTILCVEYVG